MHVIGHVKSVWGNFSNSIAKTTSAREKLKLKGHNNNNNNNSMKKKLGA